MKSIRDMCEYLALRVRLGKVTTEELVNGLRQIKDALPDPAKAGPAADKVRRAQRTITMLLRAAQGEDADEQRDLKGAHIDLLHIGRSLSS